MLTLVLFTASTCGYCGPAKKLLEEVKDSNIIKNIIQVDADRKNMALAREWGVSGVPTLIYIKDAQEVARQIGNITKESLDYSIKSLKPENDEKENS